ncbi:MAG: hypothetical protein QF819_02130 [Gemmatimonadota bacterium]|jgi:hypothetical protein|nr:hypothetical protein [Gemmatimonadota bacterium]MDP6530114.1 hypothetical protein [Gemmatimonadota bacterium]MDP6801958.1 hypothetical protein [Gemmatimonadota bacterium]MDP7031306.1 hypothetical protein [Gemmatimonadota bacterium]
MQRTRLFLGLTLLAGMLFLTGCLNTDSNPANNSGDYSEDEEAIESLMFGDMSDYSDMDVRYDNEEDSPGLAPINTCWWRRELIDVYKYWDIQIEANPGSAPTASVAITRKVTGLLNLWACGTTPVLYSKDFDDAGTRLLYFERDRTLTGDRHRGWRLLSMSGVEIASEGSTRQILSVRVQAGDLDETITSVGELIPLEDVMRIAPDTDVTLTVDTGDSTDEVFLHVRRNHQRSQFISNGDGTFTGMYHTGMMPGPRHAVVDVLSSDTLNDDTAAYDNIAWGYPYVISD